MTTPDIKREPIYIEIPEQRAYKIASFVANYATLAFLLATVFLVSWVTLPVYLMLSASVFALTILSLLLIKRIKPVVRGKLLSELQQQTGMILPETFDPQKLPTEAFAEKVSVVDESGTTAEWTAACHGTCFRFAPA